MAAIEELPRKHAAAFRSVAVPIFVRHGIQPFLERHAVLIRLSELLESIMIALPRRILRLPQTPLRKAAKREFFRNEFVD